MSEDIQVNKVSDKQARRAKHIENELEQKGMGQDQAEKEGLEGAVKETGSASV